MTSKPPTYSPMDCEQYSRLELAILQRRRLRLHWIGRGMSHIEVRPTAGSSYPSPRRISVAA
jgi:hypothetical protein